MPGFQYRRHPALPRKIAEINPESDIRVRILGRILDKKDSSFILEDDSGKVEIITDEELSFNVADNVRVFARVLPLEDSFELRAEIIQDMNKLDMDLYRKVCS
jgi:hypothetical protein